MRDQLGRHACALDGWSAAQAVWVDLDVAQVRQVPDYPSAPPEVIGDAPKVADLEGISVEIRELTLGSLERQGGADSTGGQVGLGGQDRSVRQWPVAVVGPQDRDRSLDLLQWHSAIEKLVYDHRLSNVLVAVDPRDLG
jgi:hypothetical protein